MFRVWFASLSFINEKSDALKLEEREILKSDTVEKKALRIVEELIKGPKSQMNFLSVPKGTKVNSIYFVDQTIILDLSFLNLQRNSYLSTH